MAPPIRGIYLSSVWLWLLSITSLTAQQWVLENVWAIDVIEGRLLSHPQDLYISEGRIFHMAEAGSTTSYTAFEKVDGTGRYVIPGLWDMHAHPDDPEVWRMNPDPLQRDLLLPQFVLHGVTGIRDMAGSLKEAHRWRKLGEQGKLLVPEIFACGPLLDGPNPMWDGSIGIKDSTRVKPIVDSLMLAGADFLKVYSLLPGDIYLSLAAYAKEIGFPMVGHVPFDISPSEAAQTGMKSQEHLLEILLECSHLNQQIAAGNIDYGELETGLEKYIYRQQLIMDSFDSVRFQQMIKVFLDHGTWITPSLSMWQKNAWFEREIKSDSSLLHYLPPYLRKYWTPQFNDHLKHRDNLDFIEVKRKLYRLYADITHQLSKAGVPLLAGTDMGANPLCFPGVGVHNELEMMVKSGLRPAQALRTATLNPAEFLEIESDYGSLEPGKVADLVILESNPLEDISHIRTIWGVVREGILIDPKARKQQLEKIRVAMAP